MVDKSNPDIIPEQNMNDVLKNWMMLVLTFVFVLLYAAVLIGWLKPLTNITMITRLEPIIFVIIGYYFGRLPAQQNEKTLKDVITRQTQKADATQYSKEQIQQEREALEEKIKNAKVVLTSSRTRFSFNPARDENKTLNTGDQNGLAYNSIETAVKILDS